MMPAPCSERSRIAYARHRQQGIGLIEALVTLLLTAIIGLGMTYLMGRSAVAQKDMNVLGLTVGQMRNQIMSGQCNSADTANSQLSIGEDTGVRVSAQCSSQDTVIQITSDTKGFTADNVNVPIPRISTNNDDTSRELFGGQVVINP
ncbi:hypothetical protein EZI54_11420 [Marinobacter halodurans]|uniref:Prepilin-type N-terminal cleavage/methylation domain-containing protein n=1 Tax=Marinobacter halodurans TaxID=2528979 RepID=A0ABY1ZJU2_9GAMM|nr:hypothetical protein [Marinobacter halodurans]TBW55430.1 hypothetical protein EZI54_11420 [Marinobacter halodurans]